MILCRFIGKVTLGHTVEIGGKMSRNIIDIIAIILMLPILFVSCVILTNAYLHPDKVPSFLGWKPFIVLTTSMEDEICSGDVAVVDEINPDLIKENDIIAFRKGDFIIIHRAVKIDEIDGQKIFYTKGDTNEDIDQETVSVNEIEGIYKFKISKLGNVAMFLHTPKGMVSCLSIPIIVFVGMQINTSIKNRRREHEVN